MKSFLQNNDTEMYSIHNEGKSVVAERLIRTLKKKSYKYIDMILFLNLLLGIDTVLQH